MLTVTLREAYGYRTTTFCRRKHLHLGFPTTHTFLSDHMLAYSNGLREVLRLPYGTLTGPYGTRVFSKRVTTLRVTLRLPYGTLTGPYGTQLSQNRVVTGW